MGPGPGSTLALDCKASLLGLIRGIPEATAEKWDIDWGFARTPERTWVYVGEVNWEASEWATNRGRTEQFTVKTVVNIKRRRGTPEDAEREAIRIVSLIESVVKQTPGLNVAGVISSDWIPKQLDSWPSDEFTEAQIECALRVSARF